MEIKRLKQVFTNNFPMQAIDNETANLFRRRQSQIGAENVDGFDHFAGANEYTMQLGRKNFGVYSQKECSGK